MLNSSCISLKIYIKSISAIMFTYSNPEKRQLNVRVEITSDRTPLTTVSELCQNMLLVQS